MAEATTLQALQKTLVKSGNSRETNKRIKVPFARQAVGTPMADVYVRPASRSNEIEAVGKSSLLGFIQEVSPAIQKAITAYEEVQEEKALNNALSTHENLYKNGSEEEKEKWNKSIAGLNNERARLLSQAVINKDRVNIQAELNDLAIKQDLAGKARDTEDYSNQYRDLGRQVITRYVQSNPALAKLSNYAESVGTAVDNFVLGQVSQYGSTFKATRRAQNDKQTAANLQDLLQNPPHPASQVHKTEAGISVEVYSQSLIDEERTLVAQNSADLKTFFATPEGKNIYIKVINDATDRQEKNLPTFGYNKTETRQEQISTFLKENKMSGGTVLAALTASLENDPSQWRELPTILEGVRLGTGLLLETASFKLGWTALISKSRRQERTALANAAAERAALEQQQKRNAIREASELLNGGSSLDNVKNILSRGYPSYIRDEALQTASRNIFYTPDEKLNLQRHVNNLVARFGEEGAKTWVVDNVQNAAVASSLLDDAESYAKKPPIKTSLTYQSFSSGIEKLSNWSFGTSSNIKDKAVYDTLERQGTEAFENLYVLKGKGSRDETISMVNAYAHNTKKLQNSTFNVTYKTPATEEVSKMKRLLYKEQDGKIYLRDIKTLSNSEQRELGTLMSNAVHYWYTTQAAIQKVDDKNSIGNGWSAEIKKEF